jgi:hypothetical protein
MVERWRSDNTKEKNIKEILYNKVDCSCKKKYGEIDGRSRTLTVRGLYPAACPNAG